MANFTGKYLKVWEIKEENGRRSVNPGDSKKNQDGTYSNWTWFDCRFVGSAATKPIQKDDKIEITSGMAWMNKSNKDGKYYLNITVFHFDVMESKPSAGQHDNSIPQAPATATDFEDEIPF